ncbi:hypothetical protein C8R34_13150 [Nitrosomonas sp. Nm84]|nr:hypothetical protein C8R34_13150 [Nitrosomonas sp. Nm84]
MIAFAENPEVIQCAKMLNAAMAQEDGVLCAVEQIEKLMDNRRDLRNP